MAQTFGGAVGVDLPMIPRLRMVSVDIGYVLTDKGRSLGPVVKAMRDWGNKQS